MYKFSLFFFLFVGTIQKPHKTTKKPKRYKLLKWSQKRADSTLFKYYILSMLKKKEEEAC